MSDETELQITIDDDPPAGLPGADEKPPKVDVKVGEERKKAEAAADDEPAVESLQKQLKTLEARVEQSKAAQTQAEQRAVQAEQEKLRAGKSALQSRLDTITTAIESNAAEIERVEAEIAEASEAGDHRRIAQLTRRISRAEAENIRLDEAKQELEARVKAPVQPQRQEPSDPIEAYVQGRTKPTENWLRAHPDYITDTRKNAKLNAAHFSAVGEGLQLDSPEYFSHVEQFLGLTDKTPDVANPIRESKKTTGEPPAAPTANGGAPGSAVKNNEVRLSRTEAAAATDGTHVWNYDDPKGKFKKGDPIGIQEFARRKLAMQRQGFYDRTYTDQ